MKKSLGGERLGTGAGMDVELHGYGRSTKNLSKVIRTSLAPGVLMPFMRYLALNEDTYDIDLEAKIRTLPTSGPIFGSFKQQYDIFVCPIRLYNAQLHNNALNIGKNMEKVKFPMIELTVKNPDFSDKITPPNQQQISSSSIMAYLGVRGLGKSGYAPATTITRQTLAIPLMAYWDIYKCYYANKQEEIGVVIDNDYDSLKAQRITFGPESATWGTPFNVGGPMNLENMEPWQIQITGTEVNTVNGNFSMIRQQTDGTINYEVIRTGGDPPEWLEQVTISGGLYTIGLTYVGSQWIIPGGEIIPIRAATTSIEPRLVTFDLENIDKMREDILQKAKTSPLIINKDTYAPYNSVTRLVEGTAVSKYTMNGLGIKTYLSDRFNNWLNTEWIDGAEGISAMSAVSTESGSFTMDALNLAKRVYDMLNRIAIGGGTYVDWQEAIWGQKVRRMPESPIYMGGMSGQIVFDEVISTADTYTAGAGDAPLGTLAGRGTGRHERGGRNIRVKITEPSFIIGIASITPNLDYSQGNMWYTRLKTMNDMHKPALDGIGFQELITDEFAAFDTTMSEEGQMFYRSVGKQPAWIEYTTEVNETFGTFADDNSEMFLTLNRRYSHDADGNLTDATTYIDPTKFNHVFANGRLDAMNFWVQIGMRVKARRIMSAKLIPNL